MLSHNESIIGNELIIDCDAAPSVLDGFKVFRHIPCGKITLDDENISLYLSNKQKNGNIRISEFYEEVGNEPVFALNANFLDGLLANPQFIYTEWENQLVLFFGTVYMDGAGHLSVRYLDLRGGKRFSCYAGFCSMMSIDDRAAVRKIA